MDEVSRIPKHVLLGGWACLWVVALGSIVRGEDDRVLEEPAAARTEAEQQQNLIDLGANFDANLFEQQGNGWVLRGNNGGLQLQGRLIINGRVVMNRGRPITAEGEEQPPESPTFARARALAEKRLARIDDACELTAKQRHTLRLAVESDIRRFAAAIDTMRGTYAGVRVNLNDPEGQKKWHQFQQDVQQCRQRLRTLFDSGSLFAGVLPATLDARQVAAIEAEVSARRSFRWRAMVISTVAKMDDMLGLNQKQHDLIKKALLAREPALRIDELTPEQENAHLQLNVVYMVLSGVDTKGLKAAMSDRQWKTLALLMNQGRSMRSWIEQQGILEPKVP